MAVNFTQNYGFGHVCLTKSYNAQASLPMTWSGWVNVDSTWSGADKYVATLLASTNGDGYRVQLSNASTTINPPPPGATFKISAGVDDFVFTEFADSDPVPFDEWVHWAAVFRGSGTTCTAIDIYINGVLQDTLVPTLSPTDTLVHLAIGGYRPSDTSLSAITDTCVSHFGNFGLALADGSIAQLAAGTSPSGISGCVDHVPLNDAATAETNLIGDNFTLHEVAPTGEITDCPDTPTMLSGSSYSRIMG